MGTNEIKKLTNWIQGLSIDLAIIIGLALIIQTWIVRPFNVSGSSMCNTLNVINDECQQSNGERIILNEITYLINEPQRGDVVVIKLEKEAHQELEDENKYLIKRIIGMPGDTLTIDKGDVFIQTQNNSKKVKLNEYYLNENNYGNTKPYFDELTEFKIPTDHYFLMGDNRGASADSRSCFMPSLSSKCLEDPSLAFISKKEIKGKAWFTFWPISNIKTIDKADYPELEN